MQAERISNLFLKNKEVSLKHRYITNTHIEPLLEAVQTEIIGRSVLNKPIYGFKLGSGTKKVLMWSQMHGNESTTTKALFDLVNTFNNNDIAYILEACTLYIVPILNPDGAEAYTRLNANQIDLNRDAQNQTQPESKVLRKIFNDFKPHFCYNLHGQRTIFSAGKSNKQATVSFLSPAQDKACSVTANRKISMEIIGVINRALQTVVPGQVGVYDDAFNINCVGDAFQSENVPTILFEAGHYNNDYAREKTREFIYMSYLVSLSYIAKHTVTGAEYKPYFDIPENEKLFFDIIIKNAKTENGIEDIAFLYKEILQNGQIEFLPICEKIGDLDGFFAHRYIDANKLLVLGANKNTITVGSENVFVLIKNEKISLKA
ncbi:MAG: M14 family zinc carboxypeptidase [Aestuariibaculum sp.]